jgi:hypothetical protein
VNAILRMLAQPRVHRRLRRLRTTGGPVRAPLRGRGAATPGRRFARPRGGAARGRSWRAPARAGGRSLVRRSRQRRDAQSPPARRTMEAAPTAALAQGRKTRWGHAAGLPEPPGSYGRRCSGLHRRVLARASRRNRCPERRATGGRPGERRAARADRAHRLLPVVIATSFIKSVATTGRDRPPYFGHRFRSPDAVLALGSRRNARTRWR